MLSAVKESSRFNYDDLIALTNIYGMKFILKPYRTILHNYSISNTMEYTYVTISTNDHVNGPPVAIMRLSNFLIILFVLQLEGYHLSIHHIFSNRCRPFLHICEVLFGNVCLEYPQSYPRKYQN